MLNCFEVCYQMGNHFSCNIIRVRIANEVQAAIEATKHAANHAQKYGYDDFHVHQILCIEAQEKMAKGMPVATIEPA